MSDKEDGFSEPRLREKILGAWMLTRYVECDVASGIESNPWGEHPLGLLLYTPDGYMSAQMQHPQRLAFADGDLLYGTPEEYTAAGRSYVAYSGRFFVDELKESLQHEMAVSFFPNWVGQLQVRLIAMSGERMQLRTETPVRVHGTQKSVTLTWRRAMQNGRANFHLIA
jgi:hypothetical protein